MNNLETIGFNNRLAIQIDEQKAKLHEIARVVSVQKNSYLLTKGTGVALAELSGNLFYSADNSLDLPTTGDWVYADFYDEDSHAIIHGLLPRQTVLKRKTAGKLVDFQLIAANVDTAFIIQSVDFNFNLRRLERYLVMVNEGGITPVILLSKCDLISEDELAEIKRQVTGIVPDVSLLAFSNLSGLNIDAIKSLLSAGHTYCLIGSSGVGKTTLLNNILGGQQFATQTVSKKDNKGRHTTTSRELIQLESGALLIDTPGMRELGNMSIDTGLDETFSEVIKLAQDCKFGNCSHTGEKGCAILSAIENGNLSEERYQNYLKMKKESAFYDMSYSEKREKDKAFGKLIKATLASKNKRKR